MHVGAPYQRKISLAIGCDWQRCLGTLQRFSTGSQLIEGVVEKGRQGSNEFGPTKDFTGVQAEEYLDS